MIQLIFYYASPEPIRWNKKMIQKYNIQMYKCVLLLNFSKVMQLNNEKVFTKLFPNYELIYFEPFPQKVEN